MKRVYASPSVSLLPVSPFQQGGARYRAHKPSEEPDFLKFMREMFTTLNKALEENIALVTCVFGWYTTIVGACGCITGWDLRNRITNVGRKIEWADPERRGRDAVENFLTTMYGLTAIGLSLVAYSQLKPWRCRDVRLVTGCIGLGAGIGGEWIIDNKVSVAIKEIKDSRMRMFLATQWFRVDIKQMEKDVAWFRKAAIIFRIFSCVMGAPFRISFSLWDSVK